MNKYEQRWEASGVSPPQAITVSTTDGSPVPSEKCCTKCQKWKSLENFHKNTNGVLGRESHCKSCVSAHKSKRRKVLKRDLKRAENFECSVVGTLTLEAIEDFSSVMGNSIRSLIDEKKL